MINDVLQFICKQVDNYLRLKIDFTVNTPFIQLANIAWHDSESSVGSVGDKSNAFISLVNIEEDRISKSSENFVRKADNSVAYKNPKMYLNLYLLFSVNLSSYDESLKRISYIIQFFQSQNVFTPLSSPSLPEGVDELIFDLITLSYQDLNNLWGIMGSKYLPSVLYKMRLVVIDEDLQTGSGEIIKNVNVIDN